LTRKISSTTLTWSIQTRPTCTRKIPAAAAQSRAVWNLTGQCSCSTESGAVNSTTTQSGPIPNLTGECCGTASAGVGSIHPNLPTPRSIADLTGQGRGSTRSWAIKPTRADLTGKGIHAPKTRAGSILNLSGKSARTAGTNTAGDSPRWSVDLTRTPTNLTWKGSGAIHPTTWKSPGNSSWCRTCRRARIRAICHSRIRPSIIRHRWSRHPRRG
jgi:hypothetical protein